MKSIMTTMVCSLMVAGAVAEAFVDHLEIVEINEKQTPLRCLALGLDDGTGQQFGKQGAIA